MRGNGSTEPYSKGRRSLIALNRSAVLGDGTDKPGATHPFLATLTAAVRLTAALTPQAAPTKVGAGRGPPGVRPGALLVARPLQPRGHGADRRLSAAAPGQRRRLPLHTEEYLATDNELVRNILLAVMASLAKVEAQRISERTKAGLARARAHGKKLGRPALPDAKRAKIEKLRRANPKRSIRSIAKAAGVAYETARAHLRARTES